MENAVARILKLHFLAVGSFPQNNSSYDLIYSIAFLILKSMIFFTKHLGQLLFLNTIYSNIQSSEMKSVISLEFIHLVHKQNFPKN